ncbi:MAG: cytidylate kinase family protein, partial [Hyphomicrobiaceae bacterium]
LERRKTTIMLALLFVRVCQKKKHLMERMMAVIAMTREMATLGKDVASGLADRLGLDVVHHEVVEHDIVRRSGLPESEVHRFLEGEASLLERWRIDQRRLSNYTALEILELAAKGNVLIRGWGATYLLRSVPHVMCVRLTAPMDFRTQVLMKRLSINDPSAARREIERNDAAHNGTIQRLFGADWTDAALYAATLNTARISPHDCVDYIERMVDNESFRETPESRANLADLLVDARVRSALREYFGTRLNAVGMDIQVENCKVNISGAVSDDRVIADVIRHVNNVDGVLSVESNIRHLSFSSTAPASRD